VAGAANRIGPEQAAADEADIISGGDDAERQRAEILGAAAQRQQRELEPAAGQQ